MIEPKRAKVAHFTEQELEVRGVVHVGANGGQEIPYYLFHDHVPVIAFEPHPGAFQRLVAAYGSDPRVQCFQMALTDRSGPLVLKVPIDGDDEKATALKPVHTEGHDWTDVPYQTGPVVQAYRFDEITGHLRDRGQCNTLVIDVQGMELQVLEGFGLYLMDFTYLVVECSEIPVFAGESPAAQVIAWLAQRGFRQDSPMEEHDDVCFVKVGLA